jgi:hypothetical protein
MIVLLALLLTQAGISKVRVCDRANATKCADVDSTGAVKVNATFGGTINTSCHATAADPTYTEGTDNDLSCDLTGKLRTTATGGGAGASSFTNGSVDVQARTFDADTGAGTQNVAGAILRKSASGGSVELGTSTDPIRTDPTGTTTQPVSGPLTDAQLRASAVPTTDAHTTAAAPLSERLSDGSAFYDATKTGQLPAALDGSGFLKTHEQGTAAISAASLPLPSGAATEATLAGVKTGTDKIPASPSTDRTTAAGPFSVRISDGAAFIDPRSIRALTVADIVTVAQGAAGASAWLVTGAGGTFPVTGTFWQATQPVSGTFWQATQPVSGSLTVTQPTGTNLHIVCDSGCTPGGSFSDNSAFTAGSTAINVNGGEFNDTPLADVTSGNAAASRITKQRALHVNLRDANGNEVSLGGSTGKITDGEYGVNQAKVLGPSQAPKATDSALVVAISPSTPLTVNYKNVQKAITVIDPNGRNATIKGPNAPPTTFDQAQVVAQSTTPSITCWQTIAISQTTSTRLIVGIPGKRIYICGILVVSATAQSVSVTEGTGTTCGTLPLALEGHTTVANGLALAANGGWTKSSDRPHKVTQKDGDDLCLLQSGAGQVSGSVDYVVF